MSLFVIAMVRAEGEMRPYFVGASKTTGEPEWSARRGRARRWDSEVEAKAWLDAKWPWLRGELKRSGMPVTFEGDDAVEDTRP